MSDNSFSYVGSELDVFAKATNWKGYWAGVLEPYIGSDVLDVGAGKGATAHLLCGKRNRRWVALEPDAGLANSIMEDVASGKLPKNCEVRVGTLDALAPDEKFDTILYMDVLEHIESDRDELAKAARHLKPEGYIVVLSPAHQWLFTPFDAAIGHFRRYNARTLSAATPELLDLIRVFYLDSVGMLASLANRLLLNSAHPSLAQIQLWDNWMVPVSRVVDPLIGNRVGKSIVGIFQLTRAPIAGQRQ
jgi:SAM-dependent methyltransferase